MRDSLKIALGIIIGIFGVGAICAACFAIITFGGAAPWFLPEPAPERVGEVPSPSVPTLATEPSTSEPARTQASPTLATPDVPIARIGDTIPEFSPEKPNLSLTLLWWKESGIAVDGPYVSGYYTFTARPGMRFILLAFEIQNNGIRPQYIPYLHGGEIATDKGYFYPMWDPPAGAHSDEYSPREATDYEIRTLIGDSGGIGELLPEESVVGRVIFEIPDDEMPIEARIFSIHYRILLQGD